MKLATNGRCCLRLQLLDDVQAHPFRGRGRQRHHGGRGELAAQPSEVAVVGAKIVPPLGDTVGLVHGNQADLETPQEAQEARCGQPLRRKVENPNNAVASFRLNPADLRGRQRAVNELSG